MGSLSKHPPTGGVIYHTPGFLNINDKAISLTVSNTLMFEIVIFPESLLQKISSLPLSLCFTIVFVENTFQ